MATSTRYPALTSKDRALLRKIKIWARKEDQRALAQAYTEACGRAVRIFLDSEELAEFLIAQQAETGSQGRLEREVEAKG